MVEPVWIRPFLPVETATSFPTTDGRTLSLGRGVLACAVSYARREREALQTDNDRVECRLEIADETGRVWRLEREIPGNCFLDLVRTSRQDPVGELTPLLHGLRCYYDSRVWIPTSGRVDGQLATFAYWGKQLDAVLDLMGYRLGPWDRLAIRVHAVPYGAVGYQPTPTVIVATDWAAKVVLWPTLLGGSDGPLGGQPVFLATDKQDEPQPAVRVT